MRLVDVHAHMDMEPLIHKSDRILIRASEAGVKAIISNGTDPHSNRRVLALASQNDIIKPALGVYPTHTVEYSPEEIDEEIEFIRKQKPVAIGEVGLDYKFAEEGGDVEMKELSLEKQEGLKQIQRDAFVKFIKLANELDIPLIVHSRKAENDVIDLLIKHNARKVIMHCFMGKKKYVKRIQDQGWMFSIPTVVTKLEQMQEIVRTTRLSKLLTETDAPFLGPEPEVPNEPANVRSTIRKIAEIKGMTEQETADQVFMNYMGLF
ncbi:MAG: TatD family hydrolase [Candidatus Woesearchaeota archaeon]